MKLNGDEIVTSQSEFLKLRKKLNDIYNDIDGLLGGNDRDRKGEKVHFPERVWTKLGGTINVGFVEELLTLAYLRNAMTHGERSIVPIIAIPTEDAVKRFEFIRDRLGNPPLAVGFATKEVMKCRSSDTFKEVVLSMVGKDYSQIPVYDGPAFKGLLTNGAIVRWVTSTVMSGHLEEFNRTTVDRVMKEHGDQKNYRVFPSSIKIDRVLDEFRDNRTLLAVLLTKNGKYNEEPAGIITPWDLATITKSLMG